MSCARAEGTSSGNASGNPSAILLSIENDIRRIEAMGFDCSSPSAPHAVERIGKKKLNAYLPVSARNARAFDASGPLPPPELKEAHDLITYDRRMQSVILKYTGIIETQFRARFSRAMGALHGDFCLYDADNFLRRDRWESVMADVRREIGRRSRRDRSLRAAMDRSDGTVPVDAAVECMTLGTLSKLYNNAADRTATEWVAGGFNSRPVELRSWMRTMADVRNVCAHFNPYVILRQIPSTPLPIVGCPLSNTSPFYVFPLMERMLESGEAKSFGDSNFDYAGRMVQDASAETVGYARLYIGTLMDLNVPKKLLDPDLGDWAGNGYR